MVDFTTLIPSQNPYVLSVTILVVFFAVSKIAHILISKYILKLTSKTKTEMDDLIIKKTSKPISLVLLFIGFYLASIPLRSVLAFTGIMEKIFQSVLTLIVTYIVVSVSDILIESWGRKFAEKTKSKVDDDLITLFHRFSRIALYLIGIMLILPVWGVEIGPLLASLGIAGVAIAFALQATLSNIFGGVSLIIDKSIRVGDVIEVDTTMGTVTDVGLRSTRIKTWDNEIVAIPNGKVADAKIINYLQPSAQVRGIVLFGVEYGSDTENVRKTALEVAKKHEKVVDDPAPNVQMLGMGDSSINFRLTFWVNDFGDRFSSKCELTEQLYAAFNKQGIGIPFPTRTVYMHKDDGAPKKADVLPE